MFTESPFLKDIPECKQTMRRLRKKISKFYNTHKPAAKPLNQSENILKIVKGRNLPKFVIENLKKRRNFDILGFKNVAIFGDSNINEMMALTNRQQEQIGALFDDHKQRVRNSREKMICKLERKSTSFSSNDQQENSQSNSSLNSFEGLNMVNYFDEDRSSTREANTSSNQLSVDNKFEEMYAPIGKDFFSFQGNLFSEDEWLNF